MRNTGSNQMDGLRNGPLNRWVACTMSGLYLGDLSADDLATAIEEYARAIRYGSDHARVCPPDMEFGGTPCVFRRSNEPKLEKLPDLMEVKS